MNFVSIVFETAEGYERHTIYSIGMVKYKDGKMIDSFYSLVKPPELCVKPNIPLLNNRFSTEDLMNAPTLAELWESRIYSSIGNFPILSHRDGNIDRLLANLEWFGLTNNVLHCFNSYILAMRVWDSLKHRHLPMIAEELGIEYSFENSLSKAEFYGKMMLSAAEKLKCSTLEELLTTTSIKIYAKIKSSINLWGNNFRDSLKSYNIKELEELAVELYGDRRNVANIADYINDIFYERNARLDKDFQWTEENVNKLFNVNELLVKTAENAHAEAKTMIEKLEIKIDEYGSFINYDIEIKFIPYISGYVDPEKYLNNCFMWVLCEPIGKYLLVCDSYDQADKYFDKSESWLEGLWDGDGNILDCFKDKYISYAIHELWDAHWHWHDIININKVLVEINIKHSKYIK